MVVVTQMSLDSEKSFDRIGFVVVLPIALSPSRFILKSPRPSTGVFHLCGRFPLSAHDRPAKAKIASGMHSTVYASWHRTAPA